MSQAHFRKLEEMHHGAPINQWFRPRLRIFYDNARVLGMLRALPAAGK